MAAGTSNFSNIFNCFLLILVFAHLFEIYAYDNGRSFKSPYNVPTGDFLLEQPENPENFVQNRGSPPHLEELRIIHKIKDRQKREAILNERTVRVPRSPLPQFTGNVNFGARRQPEVPEGARDPKTASVGTSGGFSGGVTFDAPTFPGTSAGIRSEGNLNGGANIGGQTNMQGEHAIGAEVSGGSQLADNGEIGVLDHLPDNDDGTHLLTSGNLPAINPVDLNLRVQGSQGEPQLQAELHAGIPNAELGIHGGAASVHGGVDIGQGETANVHGEAPNTNVGNLNVHGDTQTELTQPDPIEGESRIDDGELLAPDVDTPLLWPQNDENATTEIPIKIEQKNFKPTSTVSTNEYSMLTENIPSKMKTVIGDDLGSVNTTINTTLNVTPTPQTTEYHVKAGELLLPDNYEILQIPKPDYGKSIGEYLPGPLICLLFIKILGISSINEIEGTITFHADFTVEWIDGVIFDVSQVLDRPPPTKKEVLAAQRTLSPVFLKKLWRPDLYMEDLVKVDQPTITNKAVLSLHFNKLNGFISYTVRMSVTVNCPMVFQYFPADTQRCLFRVSSYSHTKDDMSLDWLVLDSKHTGVLLDDDSEDNFDIKIDRIDKYEYTPKWNNPGNTSFEVLTFSIAARRKISYHLIQTYLPSVFNIFVTWLVFLIPYTLYDCRIGTTMTTLLTLTAMFSAVREQSPQVNYIKAIDLWMLACVLFIFLNLVELSVMTWMRITIETFDEAEKKEEDLEAGESDEKKEHLDLDARVTPWKIKKFRKVYSYFSHYSFSMFAALFILFNIVYWTWLFTASKYFDWEPNAETAE